MSDDDREISPEKSDERGYSYAVWLLSRRNYSTLKLRRKLMSKKYTGTQADSILLKLKAEGTFREHLFIEEKIRLFLSRNQSESMIVRRLRGEGVSISATELREQMTEMGLIAPDEEDQLSQVIASEIKRMHRTPNTPEARKKAEDKILRVVFRKGLSLSKARPLVKAGLASL